MRKNVLSTYTTPPTLQWLFNRPSQVHLLKLRISYNTLQTVIEIFSFWTNTQVFIFVLLDVVVVGGVVVIDVAVVFVAGGSRGAYVAIDVPFFNIHILPNYT